MADAPMVPSPTAQFPEAGSPQAGSVASDPRNLHELTTVERGEGVGLLRPQMPELDSVRGMAILLVLFYHGFASQYGTGWFSGGIPRLVVLLAAPGWAGVNLFFVLSGFLITGILLDSKHRPDYYRRFYLRRALRILPAYYAVLLLLAALGRFVLQDDQNISWRFLGLSTIYLANVTVLFGVPMQYAVLWSLAVEEHFYFAWPVIVRNFNRHGVAVIAGAIVVATAVARIMTYRAGHYDVYHPYFTWLVADALALGALLAVLFRGRLGTRAGLRGLVLAALGLAAAFAADKPLHQHWAGGMLHLTSLNLLCTAVLGTVLLLGTGRWSGLVRLATLRFFGEISYGLYLIHMLAFRAFDNVHRWYFPEIPEYQTNFTVMLVRFTVCGGVAVAAAFLSRRCFEEPFLRLKDRIGGCVPRPVPPISKGEQPLVRDAQSA